ncbi:sulfotransferase domain protein [Hyphomonas neptunium ATCC 15444]|uniref:Sulfotransferase domain protein n=2 Tax=Hyphomonas TaxID=85 RepID=Q0BWD3_HYPNA|nr:MULTISPECIES: sulfotransferase [Hyphomonas]ABI77149.1 sulfotransferase domain protein [Hyphomonas neptunium ATCC 15444]KCZ94785.1 sulfotransferase domain-containing protein [Hyphomonas hirschiana VP5]
MRAYAEAHALCLDVLKDAPRTGEVYYLLGQLTLDHNNIGKAEELFSVAARFDPGHAGALAQQARCLLALNRRADAAQAARAAAALEPTDAFTCDTIGVVMSRAGLHTEALPFYAAATAAEPGNAGYQYNYGAALQFAGSIEPARRAYRQCAAADANDTRGLPSLVQLTRQTAEENEIGILEAMFAKHSEDPDGALRIGHALAKAHEDLKQPEEALRWLARAKAPKRGRIRHDAAADAALFKAAQRSAERLSFAPGAGRSGPVFICGMPRTGTTLVDRILSSHSALVPAGELTDFALCLKRLARTPSNLVLDPETLDAASRVDLSALGADYLESVRASLGLEGRFTDKMPLNILLAPVILAALPEARIICLRRHPADTVLSNYRQMFATSFSYYNYAYTLEDTARYYAGFDRLVRHYEKTLPPERFTVVHYEQVVTDLETETRRLLAFCGLPFEEGCLAFHENTAPVATASSAQVREPLYTSALARWRRYEAGLGPALDILEAEGCLPRGEREAR